MRCDQIRLLAYAHRAYVSIHTPTWGVTICAFRILFAIMFQSTHLHEVWRFLAFSLLLLISFNPHTYMRCDIVFFTFSIIQSSFNPHTYMRCDGVQVRHIVLDICFNPHTYMRCDDTLSIVMHDRSSFNPHTYMRCDSTHVALYIK